MPGPISLVVESLGSLFMRQALSRLTAVAQLSHLQSASPSPRTRSLFVARSACLLVPEYVPAPSRRAMRGDMDGRIARRPTRQLQRRCAPKAVSARPSIHVDSRCCPTSHGGSTEYRAQG